VLPEGFGKLRKFVHLIGSRTRDVPACSIVFGTHCINKISADIVFLVEEKIEIRSL
jgi:hypothetical protein